MVIIDYYISNIVWEFILGVAVILAIINFLQYSKIIKTPIFFPSVRCRQRLANPISQFGRSGCIKNIQYCCELLFGDKSNTMI